MSACHVYGLLFGVMIVGAIVFVIRSEMAHTREMFAIHEMLIEFTQALNEMAAAEAKTKKAGQ